METIETPKLIKRKSRFDKIYNYYDLSKEYNRGWWRGSLTSTSLLIIALILGRFM